VDRGGPAGQQGARQPEGLHLRRARARLRALRRLADPVGVGRTGQSPGRLAVRPHPAGPPEMDGDVPGRRARRRAGVAARLLTHLRQVAHPQEALEPASDPGGAGEGRPPLMTPAPGR